MSNPKASEILNLTFLAESEKQVILDVLQRDEELKKKEERRIRKLKNELLDIRRRGGNHRVQENVNICIRCQNSLGLIFERGALCKACNEKVCSKCRIEGHNGTWKCTVCAKIAQLRIVTGEWFFEERANRYTLSGVLGSDIVRKSIVRKPTGSLKKKECLTVERQPETIAEEDLEIENDASSNIKRKATKSNSKWKSIMSVRRSTQRSVRKDSNSEIKLEDIRNSEADGQSAPSNSSTPRSVRSLIVEEEDEEVEAGQCNIINEIPPDSPTSSRHSTVSEYSRRGDGSESVVDFPVSESIPENLSNDHYRKGYETPAITLSRTSLSSDRSHSELDLTAACSEKNEDTISQRSISVPENLNNEVDFLHEKEDDASSRSVQYSHRKEGSLADGVSMTSLNSMMSVYSETGDYGNVSVKGDILLTITYSYKTGALNILVKECRNLAIGDEKKQRTDPYVKSYLLPDKSRQSKRKTSFKINTTDPVYNETLKYVISHTQLETRTLQLSVWHYDRIGRNSFLGEVEIPFDSWNLEHPLNGWFPLQPKVDADLVLQYKGEITIALRYIPPSKNLTLPLEQVQAKKTFLKRKKETSPVSSGGVLEVLIKEAKNLTAVKSGGTSDTFVKGYLLPDNNKSSKHKTPVIKKSVNPRWNHIFTYSGLYPSDLTNVGLELTVWDKEAITGNVFLGGVRINAGLGVSYGNKVDWMDARGEEQQLWQRMIENPGVSVKETLMLRSSMRKNKI
ncbi:synaptotagmin-like protein 5 isoform X2 [Protopterus annectens]|uniref:synaptotagmin-like protein 5 isoform X2 n=1 Tax=Protopterus annectens TaxID=7888 RepID=UPI001CF9458F|nr:synaptotagmin-like protein 5 isoform X2 [Protopterus annectens]